MRRKAPRNPYAKELRENSLYSLKRVDTKTRYTRKLKHKGQRNDSEES
jgi:hypothetical protein